MATTTKGAVAQLLVENAKTWIDSVEFRVVGGLAGDRRLRELRAEGWSIKTRRNPEQPTSFQHQLTRVPAKAVRAAYGL